MASQRKSKPKPKAKRAAPRKKPARRNANVGFHWASFATGMVIGIALTLTGALLPGFLESQPATAPVASAKPAEASEPISFKFYDRLPRTNVDADTSAYEALAPRSDPNASYILQAGSFSNKSDAKRLQAQLLLTNLNVDVQTAELPGGSTAHRVMVGPFDSEQDTTRAMTLLREENIDPLKLELKAPSR